jgi:hypothetical protein
VHFLGLSLGFIVVYQRPLILQALQMNRGRCTAIKLKTKNRLILFCVVAVAMYAILDLTDSAALLRQWAILPICAVPIMRIAELDVDVPGVLATVIRVSAFAVLLALIVTPAYLYVSSKRKVYLVWLWIMAGWLTISVCWFFLMLIGITGMIE